MHDDLYLARKVAAICGPHSAAALAIFEMDRRRADGEDVTVLHRGNVWLVGPHPSAYRPQDGEGA